MAEETIDGKVRLGVDANNLEKGMAKAAATTKKSSEEMGKAAEEGSKKGQKAVQDLATAYELAEKRIAASTKNAEKRRKAAAAMFATRGTPQDRANAEISVIDSKITRDTERARNQRITNREKEIDKRETAVFRKRLSAIQTQEEFDKRIASAEAKQFAYQQRMDQRINRSLEKIAAAQEKRARVAETAAAKEQQARVRGFVADAKAAGMSPSQFFSQLVTQQVASNNLRQQMNAAGMAGGSGTAVWQQAMNQSLSRAAISNANYFAAQNAAGGQPPAGGGRGGGWRGWLGGILGTGGANTAGRLLGSLATGFGVGVGGIALARGVSAVIDSSKEAVAYERQKIAAENLAGSQDKLAAIMAAYEKASGGAVAKTTELANVTRLLATGFADSAPEVERFVRATRGASIALGKPEDYVIQETQLAVSNTSMKRLDQIGLGIKEVTDRIESLRQANKGMNREVAFQQAVLGLMEEKYSHLTTTIEGQATELEKLIKNWADLRLAMGQNVKGPINGFLGGVNSILESTTRAQSERQERKKAIALANDKFYSSKMFFGYSLDDFWGSYPGKDPVQIRAQRMLDTGIYDSSTTGTRYRGGGPSTLPPSAPRARFNESQMDTLNDFRQRSLDIEKQYYQASQDALEDYEEQRSRTVANYARQMARDEEDFFLQRQRAQRDYERAVVDVIRDAQDREEEMREDLADRIADAREDSAERIAEIEEEYNDRREEAQKEHVDRLMKAAGQLDAIAVLEERKRWRREQEQAEKQHDKSIAKQKENLEEQIEEAQEAFDEQLEDAREADAKRLEDMRVARDRQFEDENEDFQRRRDRAAEDHALQLEELADQHSKRITQIQEQAEEERQAWQDAFEEALVDADVYIAGLYDKFRKRDELTEKWLDKIADRMESDLKGIGSDGYFYDPKRGPIIPSDYGRNLINSSEGNSYTNATNSRTIIIQSGAFPIVTTPGFEDMVGDLVRDQLVAIMEQY